MKHIEEVVDAPEKNEETPVVQDEAAVLSEELSAVLKELVEANAELADLQRELNEAVAAKQKSLNSEYIKAVSDINTGSVAKANTQVKCMTEFSKSVAEINESMLNYNIDIKKTKLRSGVK